MRLLRLGLSLLLGTASAWAASYPTPQLLTSQPSTITLSRPAYLTPTAIPGLSTNIIRISDATVFGGSPGYYRQYYAKQQPWNSDNSRIILSHNDTTVYFLNGQTYALELTRTNLPEYPKWSSTDPNKLFGVTGSNTLVSYSVTGNSNTTIHNFTSEGFTGGMFLGVGEGNLSDDSRYAVLVGFKASTTTLIVWDVIANAEIGRAVLGTTGVDWASLSPSGTYVVVKVDGNFDVYTRAMVFQRTLSVVGTGHADICYDSAGNEVVVFVDGNPVLVQMVRLSNDAVSTQLPGSGQSGNYITWNYHISCRNTDRPGWVYISTTAMNPADGSVSAYTFRELFSLKLDGSGTIERFSQNFAAPYPVDDQGDSGRVYHRESHGVPNRDGSLMLFASDFDDESVSAIIYAYVVGVNLLTPTEGPRVILRLVP